MVTLTTVLALALFVVGVFAKINFSSVGMWNAYGPRLDDTPGVLAGEPRAIRSDDWLLAVPWTLSQANSSPRFSVENPSVGPSTSALFVGLPVRHWTALFRPSHWGFFLLDVERGFSWMWMTRVVTCFAVLFLLMYELSLKSAVLAAVGALSIFFSSFVQWWFASVAELLMCFCAACLALRYVLILPSSSKVILSSVLLFVSAAGFLLAVYPPFQIPLIYLGIALLPLLVAQSEEQVGPSRVARWACVSAALFGAALVLIGFWSVNQEVVRMMTSTVYPGERVSFGGGMSIERYFAGFFGFGLSQDAFPRQWGNICEAGSFLALWPVAALALVFSSDSRRSLRLAPLLVFLLVVTAWSFWGAPETAARASLWSMVPTTRGVIAWGIGGAIFVVCAMARLPRQNSIARIFLGVVVSALMGSLLLEARQSTFSFVSTGEFVVIFAAGVISCLAVLWNWRVVLVLSVAALTLIPNGLVNPVMSGLGVAPSLKLARGVNRFDPDKKGQWAVFSSTIEAQMVKMTGRKVMNGYQYLPNRKLLEALDPSGEHQFIYNRYAQIILAEGARGSAARFDLIAPDAWRLTIDPCDERLSAAGVNYIVFAPHARQQSFQCLERVYIEDDFSIFKRRR